MREPERFDLSALDPSRDSDRWELMVRQIMWRSTPELQRRQNSAAFGLFDVVVHGVLLAIHWWTRRDSNPHQCSNHGFEASGIVGDWKRAPVTDLSSEPAPASSTVLADQLACCTWCYPGCPHVNHFWQWRSLLCQRARNQR